MQPVTPYRFSGPLGHCQVGTVWSAVDEKDMPLTVAVLGPAAARDQRWRDAFAATVRALAYPGPGQPQQVRADVAAEIPWAAYAVVGGAESGAERVFEALGFQVLEEDPKDDQPAEVAPMSPQPISPATIFPDPFDTGLPGDSGRRPFPQPVRHIMPSDPRRRRTGLWIGLAVLVLVLASGGTAFALVGGGGNPGPASSTTSPQAAAMPTALPASPGLEPPKPGAWPTRWPNYTATDVVRTLDLDGLGFPIKLPLTWQCTLAGRAAGYVKYNCGTPSGQTPQFGGEIVVRDCAQPCDEQRRTEMRQAEEAWSTQWIQSGPFSTYAEKILQVDGEQRHGLVVVAYFRSGGDGEINRQLVLRMTAPVTEAQQLRRVATYLRSTLLF